MSEKSSQVEINVYVNGESVHGVARQGNKLRDRDDFGVGSKFDPIPAMPAQSVPTALTAEVEAAEKSGDEGTAEAATDIKAFYVYCYFESTYNMGAGVDVNYNVKNVDDTGKPGQLDQAGTIEAQQLPVGNPVAGKINPYRYYLTINLLPVSGATETWEDQNVRIHIRVPKQGTIPRQGGCVYGLVVTIQ